MTREYSESNGSKEVDMHLHLVWNTLMWFAHPSNYILGERTGGVLAGCPRKDPPSPDEMAGYARRALESMLQHLGREPEEWLRKGLPVPDPLEKAVERVARLVYDQWEHYMDGWVPWVENGNSLKQGEARSLARDILLGKQHIGMTDKEHVRV